MSFRSLRWQIQLWHTVVLSTLAIVLLTTFYAYERQARVARIDAELTGPLVALLPRQLGPPGGRRPPDEHRRDRPHRRPGGPHNDPDFEKKLEAAGHYILVFRQGNTATYRTPGAPATLPALDRRGPAMFGRWNGANRELVNLTPHGDLIILGLRDTHFTAQLRTLALRLALVGLAVVSLGLVGGHFIASRAIRPIRAIAQAARRIANGDWGERIPPGGAPNELEELRAVLNETFTRLATAYEQQRRFTADASHELGTPVAIITAQTQHALARSRTSEEYVAALSACRRAGERMRALTRSLLELAAWDAATSTPSRIECDLAELTREALGIVAPQAAAREAQLEEQLESVLVQVDPLGLSQVLLNLLENALRHNPPGVHISVTLKKENQSAVLTVSDNGRGIPPEALPFVFDRFYRADSSRSDEAGSTGLGLAIARQIAAVHQGELTVENPPTGGTRFTLCLPIR